MNRVLNFVVVAATALIIASSKADAAVINITESSTNGYTMTDGNIYVIQNSVEFFNSTAGGSGMSVEDNATVVLYIPAGVTLTAKGANGNGRIGGGAGICVPESATFIITGEGTVNATGGNAGNGENGENGNKGTEPSARYGSNPSGGGGVYGLWAKGNSGLGGNGGAGGGGAGAGIGGNGSNGGIGGNGAAARMNSSWTNMSKFNGDGYDGAAGSAGGNGMGMGMCYVLGVANIVANGGSSGSSGNAGSFADWNFFHLLRSSSDYYVATCGGGGGGGGGAGNAPSCSIGGGGASGGGGGGGGSGATAARDYDEYGNEYNSHPLRNAHGGGGSGGASNMASGKTGSAKEKTWGGYYSWIAVRSYNDKYEYYGGGGGAGGAAGAEGGAGTLYVASTATVNADREMLEAITHPAAQYTMTFDANGGEFTSSDEALTATLGCELPDCIQSPKREGYSFGGWVTLAGEEYYEASGAKSISSYPEASDVRLYAKWRLNDDYTVTTTEAVPYSYLDMNCPALLAEHGGDYEAAAKAPAANGFNKVWECYVAGISPTDVAAKFTAKIEMKDGNPVITWEPNLNADGALVRIYKVYGSETLENGGDWQSPTNSLHRFFKVGVEIP